MSDFLADRRRALEDSFFAQLDRALLEKLRAQVMAEEGKQALSTASGIHDEAVLDGLMALGIEVKTVAALTLIPLVEMAWAHGGVAQKERDAILKAAHENGVTPGSAADQLLDCWLNEKPDSKLLAVWKDYVAALRQSADPGAFEKIRDDILDRAEHVAQAADGFLGMASVSAREKAMLAELEQALKG
jgi:hypothetical protein